MITGNNASSVVTALTSMFAASQSLSCAKDSGCYPHFRSGMDHGKVAYWRAFLLWCLLNRTEQYLVCQCVV